MFLPCTAGHKEREGVGGGGGGREREREREQGTKRKPKNVGNTNRGKVDKRTDRN